MKNEKFSRLIIIYCIHYTYNDKENYRIVSILILIFSLVDNLGNSITYFRIFPSKVINNPSKVVINS